MSEVTVAVAILLLIFVLVHAVLAAVERPTALLNRHKKVTIPTSQNISSRKARNCGPHSASSDQSMLDSKPCSPDISTGTSKKTVRFVEVPTIQRIHPNYTPDDFYNDPLILE